MSELHFAILHGENTQIINDVLRAGADHSYRLKNGMNCIEFAKAFGNPDSHRFLSDQASCIGQGMKKINISKYYIT